MKTFPVPAFLHDVLGEEQNTGDLLILGAGTAIGGALILLAAWRDLGGLPWYRLWPAVLLILDIVAGALANFTRGTNDFYARRPRNRLIFIAIHAHFPVLALLTGQDLWGSLPIWVGTMAGAFMVNALSGRSRQPSLGGLVMVVGITGAVCLQTLSPWFLATGLVFMVKVAYSFAVDHYTVGRES